MPGILGEVLSLAVERDLLDRALAEAGVGWDGWPEVAASAQIDSRARLSALLLLLAAPEPRIESTDGFIVLA